MTKACSSSAGIIVLAALLAITSSLLVVLILLLAIVGSGRAEVAPFPPQGLTGAGITASAALTLWALLGFESASVAADKVRDPARTIPRAMMLSLVMMLAATLGPILVCCAAEARRASREERLLQGVQHGTERRESGAAGLVVADRREGARQRGRRVQPRRMRQARTPADESFGRLEVAIVHSFRQRSAHAQA